jgi:hypothetical protein
VTNDLSHGKDFGNCYKNVLTVLKYDLNWTVWTITSHEFCVSNKEQLPYFLEYSVPPNKPHTPSLKKLKKKRKEKLSNSIYWSNEAYMLSLCMNKMYF